MSYVLENRVVMKKVFPKLFQQCRVRRVEEYPRRLRDALQSVAPTSAEGKPTIVLLTPGPFNSAYYEHSFLADKLGRHEMPAALETRAALPRTGVGKLSKKELIEEERCKGARHA